MHAVCSGFPIKIPPRQLEHECVSIVSASAIISHVLACVWKSETQTYKICPFGKNVDHILTKKRKKKSHEKYLCTCSSSYYVYLCRYCWWCWCWCCCRQTLVCNNFYPVWLYYTARGATIRTHPNSRNENKIKVARKKKWKKNEKKRKKKNNTRKHKMPKWMRIALFQLYGTACIYFTEKKGIHIDERVRMLCAFVTHFCRCVCPRNVLHKHVGAHS